MSRSGHTLAGTGRLIRLTLRRDRVRIPVWILAIIGFTVSFLPSLPDLYPTAEARQARAALMENPATIAMTGPGYGLDDYTFGAMVAHEFLGYSAVLVAIMSLLLIVRHTRAEEESGRAELLRAAVVGRHSAVASALTVVIGVNLVIAALTAVLMPATMPELSASSSWLYSLSVASVGIVFAGVGAVVAQLTFSARGAVGLGMAVLGFVYAARAVGDASTDTLSWLSPIGWAQRTKSYVDDQWWPLLIALGVTLALIVLAVLLSKRRDVGAGMVQPRVGSATASVSLSGPIGLAWRLQRGTIIGWAAGLALLGVMYGSVVSEVESFVSGNEFIAEAFARQGSDPVAGFLGVVAMLLSTVAGGYVLQATLRMRAEETATRAEPVLAAAVPRWRFAAGHLMMAMVGGPVVVLLGTGFMGITAASAAGDWGLLPDLFLAGAVYVPALWLLAAVAVALFGLVPKLVHLVWIVLAYGIVVGMLGAFLNLPDWTLDLSPFSHVPQWPSEDITAAPMLIMTALSAGLVALGLYGFRRRDLA